MKRLSSVIPNFVRRRSHGPAALVAGLLLITAAAPVFVATSAARSLPGDGPQVARDDVIHGGPIDVARGVRDTTVVYGGPGTQEGKFETVEGVADRQGWTGEDVTQNTSVYWSPSTFHAADLDPATPGNHAWWCGTTYEPCYPDEPPEGYGNNWDQWLSWRGAVLDPAQPVTVRVTAELAVETEPGYDFLTLEVATHEGWLAQWWGDGYQPHVSFQEEFVVLPIDFAGDQNDEVHLLWRFKSDGAWSDEDCLWPTDFGGAQIDLITVTFDQGSGPVQIGPVETAEPGDPSSWSAEFSPGVGDFSKVWIRLDDIDPCYDNFSPAFAFIDDGEVVPGTGGSPCVTWCYGPDGYVVNYTGGLVGPDEQINNLVWSPPIELPGDAATGALLSFDVYEHNGFPVSGTAMVFWIWWVESTADPAGETGWSEPRNEDFLYEGGPSWTRDRFEIGDLLVPGARWVRIGLGVQQVLFTWPGVESTPAPYFDNVRLELHPVAPRMSVTTRDLAQDAYPTTGTIDPGDLGAATVRFDSARDITFDELTIVPGDSLLVQIKAVGEDGNLARLPRLHYRLFPNSVFDPYRSAGLPDEGTVDGDSVSITNHGVLYAFDLPDEDFLFPGDRLHYYFTASQQIGGEMRTAILPADTTGFARDLPFAAFFGEMYDPRFVFRALPSLRSADPADRPAVLLWERSENPATRQAWQYSLAQIGLQEAVDYDLFASRGWLDEANGLALKCSSELLAGYDVILNESGWTGGTLTGPDQFNGFPHPAPDSELLEAWFQLGDRSLLLAGDRAAFNLINVAPSFLADWVGANVDGFIRSFPEYLGGQISPPVVQPTGAPWTLAMGGWIASGCSGNLNWHRARVATMQPYGPDAATLATYGTPTHNPDVYPYAAMLLNDLPAYGSRTVTMAHSLIRVHTDPYQGEPSVPLPARARLLAELLGAFDHPGGSAPVAAPETPATVFALGSNYPNPFNPVTTIEYSLPVDGPVQLQIYSVRGELVRTLVDANESAGSHRIVWRGDDDAGRQVSSGVYVYVLKSEAGTTSRKMALMK